MPVVRVNPARSRSGSAARPTSPGTSRRSARSASLLDGRRRRRARPPAREAAREATGIEALLQARPAPDDDREAARDRPLAAAAAHRLREASPTTKSSRMLSRLRARAAAARRRAVFRLRQGRPDPHPRHDRAPRAPPASRCSSIPRAATTRATQGATIITPNRAELRAGGRPLERAKRAARARPGAARALGLDALLLTRCEDGMTLFDDAGHVHDAGRRRARSSTSPAPATP